MIKNSQEASMSINYINIFERSSGLKSEKIELDNSINTNKKF